VSRSKDAFLQVVERMLARFFLTGFGQVRPGRGLLHEGISRRAGRGVARVSSSPRWLAERRGR
jgi:hypothetical protein